MQYVFQLGGLFDFHYLEQRKNLRKEMGKAELLGSTSDMFHKPAKFFSDVKNNSESTNLPNHWFIQMSFS